MESEQNAKTSTCVSRESNKRKDSTPHRIPSCHRCISSIHMPSRYARKAPALHVCIWFRHCIGSIVEEEQAMLPDPLRRKRADCALLNPQKDTTPKSGHKRTQIDHPTPPMVPTGQQLTTYLAVEWTAMQAIGSWLFLLLLERSRNSNCGTKNPKHQKLIFMLYSCPYILDKRVCAFKTSQALDVLYDQIIAMHRTIIKKYSWQYLEHKLVPSARTIASLLLEVCKNCATYHQL